MKNSLYRAITLFGLCLPLDGYAEISGTDMPSVCYDAFLAGDEVISKTLLGLCSTLDRAEYHFQQQDESYILLQCKERLEDMEHLATYSFCVDDERVQHYHKLVVALNGISDEVAYSACFEAFLAGEDFISENHPAVRAQNGFDGGIPRYCHDYKEMATSIFRRWESNSELDKMLLNSVKQHFNTSSTKSPVGEQCVSLISDMRYLKMVGSPRLCETEIGEEKAIQYEELAKVLSSKAEELCGYDVLEAPDVAEMLARNPFTVPTIFNRYYGRYRPSLSYYSYYCRTYASEAEKVFQRHRSEFGKGK